MQIRLEATQCQFPIPNKPTVFEVVKQHSTNTHVNTGCGCVPWAGLTKNNPEKFPCRKKLVQSQTILVLFVLVYSLWALTKETLDMSCLLQTYYHLSTNLWRNQLWLWLEEGCRKPVLGAWHQQCNGTRATVI